MIEKLKPFIFKLSVNNGVAKVIFKDGVDVDILIDDENIIETIYQVYSNEYVHRLYNLTIKYIHYNAMKLFIENEDKLYLIDEVLKLCKCEVNTFSYDFIYNQSDYSDFVLQVNKPFVEESFDEIEKFLEIIKKLEFIKKL